VAATPRKFVAVWVRFSQAGTGVHVAAVPVRGWIDWGALMRSSRTLLDIATTRSFASEVGIP